MQAHLFRILATGLILAAGLPAAAQLPDSKLLAAVAPGATGAGAFTGDPPSAPALRDGRVVGFLFFTRQVIASRGFSGKPLDILVGLDTKGRITGARIIEHHEPILAIGVSDDDLTRFIDQHRGLDIRQPVRVERRARPGADALAAISGASVSSVVLSDTILRSARIVARQRGIIDGGGVGQAFDRYSPATWAQLRAEGSIVRRALSVGEVRRAFEERNVRLFPQGMPLPDDEATFVDLYIGLATPARVGQNLLGDLRFNRIRSRLRPGDQIVFVAANGLYSFKGTSWRRRGTFDRIQITQGDRSIILGRDDHIRPERLRIEGAPEFREASLFLLRAKAAIHPLEPWRLDLLVEGDEPGAPVIYSIGYRLPDRYRPAPVRAEASLGMPWPEIWQNRIVDVATLVVVLGALAGILFFQNALAQRKRLFTVVRTIFLIFTLIWIGWYAAAQLTVLNVLVFAEALRTAFLWDRFLLDPLVFILWGFVALTLLFWGRGVFCGWLCPFGALQDLLNTLGQKLRLRQITVPFGLHERLWPLKYVIFIGLFGLSLGGMAQLPLLAEVEPFKTAIVMRFDRAWPYLGYAALLLAIGLFINRFFCRYLCPLGGALAFPSRLRMFEWLERRWQCGIQCQICANRCPVQAIHPNGRINPNECIHCLQCQMLYHDDNTCPPLVERRKRRDPQMTNRLIQRLQSAEEKGENADKSGDGV